MDLGSFGVDPVETSPWWPYEAILKVSLHLELIWLDLEFLDLEFWGCPDLFGVTQDSPVDLSSEPDSPVGHTGQSGVLV